MCGPILSGLTALGSSLGGASGVGGLATFALGATQSLLSYSAQRAQAEETERSAKEAHAIEQAQISNRQLQENQALRQKQRLNRIEEARQRADVQVNAASGGVSGITLDNLLTDVSRRAATDRQVEESNTAMILEQLRNERKGVTAKAKSRINSSPKPSALSLVTGIGGAALSGFNAANKRMT